MKVITDITTYGNDAKTKELGLVCGIYKSCLFPSKESFDTFIKQLEKLINDLNVKYPGEPIGLSHISEHGIHICSDKEVVTIKFASIYYLYDLAEGDFQPIEDYNIRKTMKEKTFTMEDLVSFGNEIFEDVNRSPDIYWQQVTNQAAIGAMQVMLTKQDVQLFVEDIAEFSVKYARALVKELKKDVNV